jgi:subtilisin family serine protease
MSKNFLPNSPGRVLAWVTLVMFLAGLIWWAMPEPAAPGRAAIEHGENAPARPPDGASLTEVNPPKETNPAARAGVDSAGNLPTSQTVAAASAPPSGQEAESDLPPALQPGALPTLADILEETGDLSLPENRARAVARMREVDALKMPALAAWSAQRGLPLRIEQPGGRVQELTGVQDGRPVYFTTHNVNAAISTGANLLQQAPYNLTGAGLTLGIWDGGSVRTTHQEFSAGGRVTSGDGAAVIDHATHVAGTIGAVGLVPQAKGMAPAAMIKSYDWNSDKTEMTALAAAAPLEAGKIQLSNHSYGFIGGWNYVNGGSPYRLWEWNGSGTAVASIETDFGMYNTYSRDSDALAYAAPYYLIFRSAGNDRTDNPQNGQSVALAAGSATVVAYDSGVHPAGDGVYRGGFEAISFDAIAKNVITIGSVNDAVTGGLRSPGTGTVSSFSSWGPTDDGRIKPDLVANGDAVYSTLGGSDASYGTFSGTSMATPNATGTAALLIAEYGRLFPGSAMRSSTLKGLLLHTADDRGRPGPDYQNGWGLLDGVAAVDLIRDHAAAPLRQRLEENQVTSTVTTFSQEFVWDGVSPIRATLVWTDPAGSSTTTTDSRTIRLRNNLDLKVIAPTGTNHLPWVMPFVGTWTQASMDLPAVRGVNNVDNIEQVLVENPSSAGTWRCVVSFQGTLTNNLQAFSLLLDGAANVVPPPPPLALTGVTPASGYAGLVTLDLEGTSFTAATAVRLERAGKPDIPAGSVSVVNGRLRCAFNLATAAPGLWQIRATNPDSTEALLSSGYTLLPALWSDNVDGPVTGWMPSTWAVANTASQSLPNAWFLKAVATKTTTNLVSPAIAVPAGASNLQFKFHHSFNLQTNLDAGQLEFSLNNGAWFNVTAAGSGAAFVTNGYTGTVSSSGISANRNAFAGQQAWSGNSNGFIQTVINLTDTAKYAGQSLQARWRLATNASTESPGWWIDSIALTGEAAAVNSAPVISSPASAAAAEPFTETDGTVFNVTGGQSVNLSVSATDDGGAANLTYTWSSAADAPGPVTWSENGTTNAKDVTATFEVAGDYRFTVTVADAAGLAVSSQIAVRVAQTPAGVRVEPGIALAQVGGTQIFDAALLDQFGDPTLQQPPAFGWTVSGGGSIDSSGLFSANRAGGPFTVTAANGTFSGTASLTVNKAPVTVTLTNLTQVADGLPKPVTATTTPAGLPVGITYQGSFSAPSVPGTYAITATVMHPNYQGSATGTLELQSPLPLIEAWATTENLSGDEASLTADPDGDQMSNLMEYALGLEPLQANALPAGELAPDPSSGSSPVVERLTLRFTRPVGLAGVVYQVKVSGDLDSWQTVSAFEITPGPDPGTETVTARDPVPAESGRRRFIRLDVSTTVP